MQLPNTYDPERRYIFSNWTSEDFTGNWGGVPTVIVKGESIELPQFKAISFCKHLVDREMQKAGAHAVDSDEARQPFEAKTIVEITGGIDSPALANLKEKIRAEVKDESAEMKSGDVNVKKVEVEKTKEFEDVEEEVDNVKVEKEPKAKKAKK